MTAHRKPAPQHCILLTGFEPFGDDPSGQGLNPSALIAQALHGETLGQHRITAAVLPCVFGQAPLALHKLIAQHRPTIVVCLGQAGGAAGIRLERIAVNLDDAPLPDNAGICLRNQAVIAGGPAAYFSSLPLAAMQSALQRENVECEFSSSAGHFVCNHVFYALMHTLADRTTLGRSLRRRRAIGGFMHVPYLPEQAHANMPSMALDDMVCGVRVALQAVLDTVFSV